MTEGVQPKLVIKSGKIPSFGRESFAIRKRGINHEK
jgi:hypothetical protein